MESFIPLTNDFVIYTVCIETDVRAREIMRSGKFNGMFTRIISIIKREKRTVLSGGH